MEACTTLGYARSPPSLSSLALSPFCSDPCSRRNWGGGLHQYPGEPLPPLSCPGIASDAKKTMEGKGQLGTAVYATQQVLVSGGHASRGWREQMASSLGTSWGKGSEVGRTCHA